MADFIPISVSRHIDALPEKVYDAWLDPSCARTWLFATPEGDMVVAEVDARVGGKFQFVDRRDGEDVLHTGEYLEIDRPRRLAFTFGVPQYSDAFDPVTIDIAREGDGCMVTLTHEMNADAAEWTERTREGWGMILAGLAAEIEKG
jgi:uncharacterized protein YndB with AHSA1/START domain